MPEACVSQNMSITDGALGIEKWSTPRIVYDQYFSSVGDGAFTAQTTLPGKLMIDSTIETWTSDSPLDTMILLRVQRDYRDWEVSNPNYVQIRDRVTYGIDEDPRTPDTTSVYLGASGGAADLSSDRVGTPYVGRFWVYEDPSLSEDWLGPVPAGADFNFWYRCYLWTPPPWSNNANDGSPEHAANVRGVRVQLMAFPTRDPEVTS